MGGQLTESAPRKRTQKYWEKKPGYDCYINELLGRELQEASKDPTRLRGVGKPQDLYTLDRERNDKLLFDDDSTQ